MKKINQLPMFTFLADFCEVNIVDPSALEDMFMLMSLGYTAEAALYIWSKARTSQSNSATLVADFAAYCHSFAHAWSNWEGYPVSMQEIAYAEYCSVYSGK